MRYSKQFDIQEVLKNAELEKIKYYVWLRFNIY